MARPKKCTVDYFPHFITATSRTVFVLEEKYGNDGYALWFKLLELLAATDGHYIDLNDTTDLEFFAAKVKIDVERALEIIDQLAKLKAIDRELWKHKIIWSQNFVDNLSDLYTRRRVSLPQKPSLEEFMYTETQSNESLCMQKLEPSDNLKSLCTTETTKVNKSIVKESKEKDSKGNVGGGVVIDDNNPFKLVANYYENNIGQLSSTVMDIIKYYLNDGIEAELIVEAIKVSCMNNKRTMSYAEGVLKNWIKEGIKTVEQYKASLVEKEAAKANLNKNIPKKNKWTEMDSRDIDFDEIERLEQEYIKRKLEEMNHDKQQTKGS